MRQTIALLGSNGLVGSRLCHYLQEYPGLHLVPLTRAEADVTKPESLSAALEKVRPNWVINSTAFLNTDRCEESPDKSYAVNFLGARHLAEAVQGIPGARLIHFSTDYVFDGKTGGYDETAHPRPLSYYGLHKFLAEEALRAMPMPAYIFRIASLVGAGEGKPDIVKALLSRVAGGAPKLPVVDELEISMATPCFLAETIAAFTQLAPDPGIYHVVAEGKTSWFQIVQEAFAELDVEAVLEPVSAAAFPRLTPRPMKSWMKTEKLAAVLGSVPGWRDALCDQIDDLRDEYLAQLNKKSAAA